MNERIESLMYQSGLTADGCWNEMDAYDRGAIERMIVLVIRECEGICLERAKVLDEYLKSHAADMHESAFDFTNGAITGSLRNAQYIRRLMDLKKE